MKLFLRIETRSNILGSKEKNVTYIATSEVKTIRSDSNGGTIVSYGVNQEITVPELTPDELMTSCAYMLQSVD